MIARGGLLKAILIALPLSGIIGCTVGVSGYDGGYDYGGGYYDPYCCDYGGWGGWGGGRYRVGPPRGDGGRGVGHPEGVGHPGGGGGGRGAPSIPTRGRGGVGRR